MNCNRLIYLIVPLAFMISCKSFFIVDSEEDFKSTFEKESLKFEASFNDYEIFVFKLCEEAGFEKVENLVEELAYPLYTLCDSNDSKIVEEIYLLLPKSNSNKTVIYITTVSHKYIKDNCGVFNCDLFKSRIFVEDVDIVYLGSWQGDKILFYSNENKTKKRHLSTWNLRFESNSLFIEDVTLVDTRNHFKPQVVVDSIFSTPLKFVKEKRTVTYGKNSSKFQDECFNSCNLPVIKLNGKNIGNEVDSLFVTRESFYFQSRTDTINEYYKFPIERMPYSFSFANE